MAWATELAISYRNAIGDSAQSEIRVAPTDFALDTPLAPYFPVIQSSGMGKTKLFIEMQNMTEMEKICQKVFHGLV